MPQTFALLEDYSLNSLRDYLLLPNPKNLVQTIPSPSGQRSSQLFGAREIGH